MSDTPEVPQKIVLQIPASYLQKLIASDADLELQLTKTVTVNVGQFMAKRLTAKIMEQVFKDAKTNTFKLRYNGHEQALTSNGRSLVKVEVATLLEKEIKALVDGSADEVIGKLREDLETACKRVILQERRTTSAAMDEYWDQKRTEYEAEVQTLKDSLFSVVDSAIVDRLSKVLGRSIE